MKGKTADLDSALKETDKKLGSLDKSTGKVDTSFKKMTSVAGVTASAIKGLAVAGLAAATALTAVIINSAKSQQELSILSRQAKLSTDDFESLAFATEQYGINAEQIADISKDLSDKMGEFSKVGTGAFQDFADIVGMTKEEAMQAAKEFENMSSDQVIGQMVSQMEAAGASGNQMTFALESMGNDLSRLIPLFANNNKELDTLTKRYNAATKSLKLTNGEAEALQDTAESFSLATKTLGDAGNQISANLAPIFDDFFNSVIGVVPTATQAIIDFVNSFKTPEDIENLSSVQSQIVETEKELAALREREIRYANDDSVHRNSLTRMRDAEELVWLIDEQVVTLEELRKKEAELTAQRLDDAEKLEGGKISAVGGVAGTSTGGTGDEIQALEDRFKTEQELLLQKLESELIIAGENNQLKLDLENEYQENLKAIKDRAAEEDLEREEQLSKQFEDLNKRDRKEVVDNANAKRKTQEQYFSIASNLNSALLEDNKEINAGLVVADTASAIMASLKINPYDYLNVGVLAATGLAQLSNVLSSGRGGGNSTSGVTGSPGSYQPVDQVSEASLNISDSDQGGDSQSITIKIDSDDTETARFISGILGTAKVNGTI